MPRSIRYLAILAVLPMFGACASGGSVGLARGPTNQAVIAEIGAPPDTVMQRAWEVLRGDGVQVRSFQRLAGDTTNMARMESDWIYVPVVFPSAPLGGVNENEKWIKLLFWAEPYRGGTRLYVEPLYNPYSEPTEPTQWSRLRPLSNGHPSWQYVDEVGRNMTRRMTED
ncbi:MAG: hypothetical protein E4H28_02490 [Gemmatimonadales bacterium]|nr:MAG: hypothetical protein E4H28_02490 [Gemmatimonadales bacterium]